ncbi:glycosyltransferase [Georgenia muralis]
MLAPAEPLLDHLARLTDARGLFEHALGDVPRPEHGYCVDDAARALVVVCREPAPGPAVLRLGEQYLALCVAATVPDGRARNRMDTAGRWTDQPALGDWWGRALWGLGTAAAHGPPQYRERALTAFATGAGRRSPDLRATAFSVLGAGAIVGRASPDAATARATALLDDAARTLHALVLDAPGDGGPGDVGPGEGGPGDGGPGGAWPWPEPRLTYANATVPEAMLVAGSAPGHEALIARGTRLLAWLLEVQTHQGHLSVVPVGGRGPGDPPPGFDQQPIEVAAIADACARAHDLTGEERWLDGVALARDWFLGDNDVGVPMLDPRTGAGYDGLTPLGRNDNRGAESTLAAISTLQQARRLGLT